MTIDLNLIRVLVAVIEEGTLTAAAERLHVTQPSVSHALNRLRQAANDDLFVRDGRLVRPTRAATELYDLFGKLPQQVDDHFSHTSDFDPLSSTRTFHIGLTDLGEMSFLSPLASQLQERAPKTRIEVLSVQIHTLVEQLATEQLDAAVASWKPSGRIESIPMRRESYLCLAPAGMFGPDGPTRCDFELMPRAQVSPDTGHIIPSHLWESAPPGSVVVRSFGAIPPLLAANRMISVVPSIVASSWTARWGLEAWPIPVELPDVIVYCHVRSGRLHAAQRWFMQQVMEAASVTWNRPHDSGPFL